METLKIESSDGTIVCHEPANIVIDGALDHAILLYAGAEGSVITQTEKGQPHSIDIRANNVTVDGLQFRERGVRLRFGASNCRVQNCSFVRDGVSIPPGDVVAIQIKGGDETQNCRNNIIENNRIVNYTDGVQTTDAPQGSRDAAGTIIRGNMIIATVAKPGIENAIDLKVGGFEENPLIIEGNYISGYRAYPNPNNVKQDILGYAFTFHNFADHVITRYNRVEDCTYAFQMVRQYRGEGEERDKYIPNFSFAGNQYSCVDELILTGADEHMGHKV